MLQQLSDVEPYQVVPNLLLELRLMKSWQIEAGE